MRMASRANTHSSEIVKDVLPVLSAMDYSYLSATIGSTRVARRAGM